MTLPTQPGLYQAAQFPLGTEDAYNGFLLTEDGRWLEVASEGHLFRWDEKDLETIAPMTSLAPLVAEAFAEAMCDAVPHPGGGSQLVYEDVLEAARKVLGVAA